MEISNIIKMAVPIILMVILFVFYGLLQKRKMKGNLRTKWCKLQQKKIESFKLDISSPRFKTYIFIFNDAFGNEIEVETNDKRTFNKLVEGEEGYLTYSENQFISFSKDNPNNNKNE